MFLIVNPNLPATRELTIAKRCAAALYSCLGIFLRFKRRALAFSYKCSHDFYVIVIACFKTKNTFGNSPPPQKTKVVVYYTVHSAHNSSSRQKDVYLAADKIEHINSLCSGVDKRGTAFYKMNKSDGKSCVVDGYIICFISMFLHD